MKLIFKGVVQGVGFRPTIYRIAKDMGLNGYVLNKGSEVEVVIDRDKNEFIKRVKKNLPSIAEISDIKIEQDEGTYKGFKILHSEKGSRRSLIPVDVGICDKCLDELFDKNNRRYLFPFTNCTVCGARFSLIKDVPYDRVRTSMNTFNLCESCREEYSDPLNRRYHAQTISCPTCGPVYHLYDKNKKNLDVKNPIKEFARMIDDGKIGVIKSWGGMHLCCKIEETSRFRKWYRRPQKAFAVMVKNLVVARRYGEINEMEEKQLTSKSKPIVLVKKKKAEEVSPGLNTIGVYLPYTGLHHILFHYLKADALVMTSANIPGEPMLTNNQKVFLLKADMYLLHNREIPNRVDDTVLKIWQDHVFFIRKSRGFVPQPIAVSYDKKIISVGAGENITGAVSCDKNIYPSQYIGDSQYYETLNFLEKSIRHLMKLTMDKQEIDAIAMDLHPGYDSRRIAEELSEEFHAPLYEIQHHWAHAASLLVDSGLDESVVLTLDGLGYGTDGTFWGGEVLLADYKGFKRVGHLEQIPLLGGDKATYDPRRLVFAIFKKFNKEKYFTGEEARVLSKMMNTAPVTSSLGRVLDAISCYLNICTKRTYDGEPAMKLEKYLAAGEKKYFFEVKNNNGVIKTVDVFKQLDETLKDVKKSEKTKADVAYSMVKSIIDSLTEIAVEEAEKNDIGTIGVTGGVSYDVPIVEMIKTKIDENNLKLIVHDRVPNGDGGISIGQNAIVGHKIS